MGKSGPGGACRQLHVSKYQKKTQQVTQSRNLPETLCAEKEILQNHYVCVATVIRANLTSELNRDRCAFCCESARNTVFASMIFKS